MLVIWFLSVSIISPMFCTRLHICNPPTKKRKKLKYLWNLHKRNGFYTLRSFGQNRAVTYLLLQLESAQARLIFHALRVCFMVFRVRTTYIINL